MKDRSSASSSPLDGFLCFSLYAANHAMNRVYKPLLTDLGLTYPQYLVMVLLWDEDGRLVGELGECLALESNTLTPLLKRLEAMGLVHRIRDPADERRVRISLTKKGNQLRRKAACIPDQITEVSGLSARKLLQLNQTLTELRKTLASSGSNKK